MYVLKTPRGKLVESTVSGSRDDCWIASYDYIAVTDAEWGRNHWKRWNPSQRSARKMGYHIVKCKLVESKP